MTMNKEIKIYNNLGLIVAVGQNNEIGYNNDLIWKIKEDLTFFKNVTMNSYIIMGKKTYDSMPKKLSGRTFIVLSKNQNFTLESSGYLHREVEETLSFITKKNEDYFWVIGGAMIYKQFLPYVNVMHMTKIEQTFSAADTFFPELNSNEWNLKCGEKLNSPEGIVYSHNILTRKKNYK